MAIGDVARLAVENENSAQDDFINVFHYRQLALQAGGKGTLEAATLAWLNVVYPLYAACISDKIGLRRVQTRFMPLSPAVYEFIGTGEKGLQTGDAVPNQIAPIVSWRTGSVGRSYRGRTFLPPCAAQSCPGPNLAGGQLVLMDAYAQASYLVDDTLNGNGIWELVIWSETIGGVSASVQSHVIPGAPGVQKRRRQGVGS